MQAERIIILSIPYDGLMQQGRPAKRPRTDFGTRLFEARQSLGLSQQEVASQLGITQSAYAAWERSPVALRPEQLRKLIDILKISADELVGFSKNKRSGGPIGKARRIFEEVSKLPRSRQQRVVAVVEDMLTAAHQASR